MIFIVTHRRGFEADRVIDQLNSLGESVFRFNTDLHTGGYSVSLLLSESAVSSRIAVDSKELDTKLVSVAWFQQPWAWPTPTSPIEAARQASHEVAVTAILDLIQADWLNSPSSAMFASNKVRQLLLARKIGFFIPETLIGNQPSAVRNQVEENPDTVVKSIAPQWILTKKGDFAAYTQQIESEWLASDEAIIFAPVAYQKFHKRRRDIRIVVVGSKFFPVEYTSDGIHSEYDVRKNVDIGCQPCDMPEGISGKLKMLMDEFNIQFCSADFIESVDGKLYFIDLNVTGSWWWIDDVYSGAVTKAISSYLILRSHVPM